MPPHTGSAPRTPNKESPHGPPQQENRHSRAGPGAAWPQYPAAAVGQTLRQWQQHQATRDGWSRRSRSSASAVSGARNASSGSSRAWSPRPSGYAGGFTPEPDLRRGVLRAAPATPRSCSSSTTRARCSYETLLKAFWEIARPDPGHAPGQRRRHAVPLGDLRRPRRAAAGARRGQHERATRSALTAAHYGDDHHRDRATRADVLLRRGLPPAVPGEEPERLLRAGQLRCSTPEAIALAAAWRDSSARQPRSTPAPSRSFRRWRDGTVQFRGARSNATPAFANAQRHDVVNNNAAAPARVSRETAAG